MEYSSRKFKKAISLPDSDKKLSKLEELGLSFGCFNKEIIIAECRRLRNLGYKTLADRYLESLQNKEKNDE